MGGGRCSAPSAPRTAAQFPSRSLALVPPAAPRAGTSRRDVPKLLKGLPIMDVPVSPALKQRRQRRRWLLAGGAIALLALVTVGLSRLQPAAPSVEKSTLFMDTVKRGEMLRQVRGNGTLVPEDIRWIPTVNAGRVERILVLPGARSEGRHGAGGIEQSGSRAGGVRCRMGVQSREGRAGESAGAIGLRTN